MKIYGEFRFATEYAALSVSKGYEEDLGDVTVEEGAKIRRCKDLEVLVSTVLDAYSLNILTKVEFRLLRNKMAMDRNEIAKFAIAEDSVVTPYKEEALRSYARLEKEYRKVYPAKAK